MNYVYQCPKTAVPPVIDGRIDDDTWKNAPVVSLVRSETGDSVVKPTSARMCWDDECLYIAFECVDQDIYNSYTKRDDPIYKEEVVEAFLDPDCDLVHYFEINVSPGNIVFDAVIHNPAGDNPGTESDTDWNCEGLRTAVFIDGTIDDHTDIDRGWSVEYAIPFASLGRKTPRIGETWKGNLYRIDHWPEPLEFQAWSPTLRDPARFHVPSRFGNVVFVEAEGVRKEI